MSYKKSVNIAIFGLNLRALSDLKMQIKQCFPQDINIHWRNITEPNLNTLFIQSRFLDTPSIQNHIRNHPCPLLHIEEEQNNNSLENETLYLPLLKIDVLQQWIYTHILNQFHREAPKVTATQTTITPTRDKHQLLENLLNPNQGKIKIYDHLGLFGIADAKNMTFLADSNRLIQCFDNTLNYSYATLNDNIRLAKTTPQNLQFWLWNLIWRSPNYLDLAPEDGTFKLKYWPQPDDGFDRRDILRLSACFAQGTSITHASKHLNMSVERVRQFIAAGVGASLIYAIPHNQAHFQTEKAIIADANVSQVRKFFSSLRRRLGL